MATTDAPHATACPWPVGTVLRHPNGRVAVHLSEDSWSIPGTGSGIPWRHMLTGGWADAVDLDAGRADLAAQLAKAQREIETAHAVAVSNKRAMGAAFEAQEKANAERDQARAERDLAIAHDRQPYPTADAYERACAALHKHRDRANTAEAERDQARAEAERATVEREQARTDLAAAEDRWVRQCAAFSGMEGERRRLRATLAEAQATIHAWRQSFDEAEAAFAEMVEQRDEWETAAKAAWAELAQHQGDNWQWGTRYQVTGGIHAGTYTDWRADEADARNELAWLNEARHGQRHELIRRPLGPIQTVTEEDNRG